MDKLKQAIIEKIHGLPWKEAVDKEFRDRFSNPADFEKDFALLKESLSDSSLIKMAYPITLSRVLQALHQEGWEAHDRSDSRELTNNKISMTLYHKYADEDMGGYNFILEWKLLKEDKSTAELEDQSEDTILALTKIFL